MAQRDHDGEGATRPSRSRDPGPRLETGRGVNAFILAFLAIQLLLPLRGFVLDKHASRGDFSWNMYSHSYTCRESYVRVGASGDRATLATREILNRPKKRRALDHRDRLPRLHAWLCDNRRRSASEAIVGQLTCSIDGGPGVPLVDEAADVCAAANYGVLLP